MGLGAVDYLIKMDLTAENLTEALARAATPWKRKKRCARPGPEPVRQPGILPGTVLHPAVQRRVPQREQDPQPLRGTGPDAGRRGLHRRHRQHPQQQGPFPRAAGRAERRDHPAWRPTSCPNTCAARVTGWTCGISTCCSCWTAAPAGRTPWCRCCKKPTRSCTSTFPPRCGGRWGAPTAALHHIPDSQKSAFSALPLLSRKRPHRLLPRRGPHPAGPPRLHRGRSAGLHPQKPSKKLSLNDVAAVFNFSPGYLSQLFSQNGETSFVEFVTETRIAAAKELMASTDLKIYEISEMMGFESAFYFSKVVQKDRGRQPPHLPAQTARRLRSQRGRRRQRDRRQGGTCRC